MIANVASVGILAAGSSTGTTAVQMWTLVVAALAVLATVIAAVLLRRTGKGTVDAARQAASASERSAQAAEKSAEAAQQSVGVNRETAVGVAQRAQADALAKRYQDAALQLGHESAAVRLAGVYAIAKLADDWPEQRQQCIDVLCAYVRMHWSAEPNDNDRQVRAAIISSFNEHLKSRGTLAGDPERAGPWSHLRFDFTGAQFRDLRLSFAVFRRLTLFDGAVFSGDCQIDHCSFFANLSLAGAHVDGALSLGGIDIPAVLGAGSIRVSRGGKLRIGYSGPSVPNTGETILNGAQIDGTLLISVEYGDASIQAMRLRLGAESIVSITWPKLIEKTSFGLQVEDWSVADGAQVWLPVGTSSAWVMRYEGTLNAGPPPDYWEQ